MKVVYIVLGVIFLMLGVIGLVIPIIPGILFLMAALYVLGKVSVRVRQFTERDPRIREMQRRLDQFGEVGVVDRLQLAGWMALDAGIKGAQSVSNGVSSVTRTIQRRASQSG